MTPHRRELVLSEWVIALALLVLIPCMVGLWWVDRQRAADVRRVATTEAWSAYDGAIASCERGNVLREAASDQAVALRSVSFIVSAFLDSSVDLRADAGSPQLAEQARQARDAIAQIADRVVPLDPVRCADVIQPPTMRRLPSG